MAVLLFPFKMSLNSTSDHPDSTLPDSGNRGMEEYEQSLSSDRDYHQENPTAILTPCASVNTGGKRKAKVIE